MRKVAIFKKTWCRGYAIYKDDIREGTQEDAIKLLCDLLGTGKYVVVHVNLHDHAVMLEKHEHNTSHEVSIACRPFQHGLLGCFMRVLAYLTVAGVAKGVNVGEQFLLETLVRIQLRDYKWHHAWGENQQLLQSRPIRTALLLAFERGGTDELDVGLNVPFKDLLPMLVLAQEDYMPLAEVVAQLAG